MTVRAAPAVTRVPRAADGTGRARQITPARTRPAAAATRGGPDHQTRTNAGTLELFKSDQRIAPGGLQQRRLLAFLLAHPNQTIPNDVLAEAMWGPEVSPSATKR